MPPTTLLVYGNPKGGTPLMLAAPDFGIELPLKLLVREETGGKVLVVYTPAAALEGRHGLPAGLATRLARRRAIDRRRHRRAPELNGARRPVASSVQEPAS